MRKELLRLLRYYEDELGYLRRQGTEFGKRHPRVAAALQLEPTRSEDPHVERLLEGFAFLAARVHQKIDDELPQVTQGILDSVYPEYARPVPSMSLVQMHLDKDQGKLTTGYKVERESPLVSFVPREAPGSADAGRERPNRAGAANRIQCRFRTCWETTLWPISVNDAAWVAPHALDPPVRATEAVGAVRVLLKTQTDASFARLEIDRLRFFIHAEQNIALDLYELLCNNCVRILLRKPGKGGEVLTLPANALRPVGFEPDEGVLPLSRRSHLGFRLLTEYFAFPEKFFFLELSGLDRLRASGFTDSVEIVFLISKFERAERRGLLERSVNASTMKLGCTPIINLFSKVSEPILLNQRQHEYQLVADARRRDSVSVYTVDRVTAVTGPRDAAIRFEPLYSFRHGHSATGDKHLWQATRRPSFSGNDDSTDVFLSFVDSNAAFSYPDIDSVTADILCYNADHPRKMPIGQRDSREIRVDFEMPGGGPVRNIEALVVPTPLIEARTGSLQLWKLISLLSLNFVSLVDDGPATLQQVLREHNLRDSPASTKEIESIRRVLLSPTYARIVGEHGLAFARGQKIELELDEDQFAGAGAYLFASVLEHFLGTYTSLNSFNVLQVRSTQRKETLKQGVPRSGWKPLV